jgi:TonB family protein
MISLSGVGGNYNVSTVVEECTVMAKVRELLASSAAMLGACAVAGVFLSSPAAWANDANYIAAHVDDAYPHYQPPYPDSAQLNGEQGAVTVDVQVSSSGQIRKVRLVGSSGFDDLDNAALSGVMAWHFVPAVRDGSTATDWATVKIVFQLPTAAPAPTQVSAPAR